MQLDPLRTTTTVDSKTAEETLALAIRLQQERGDRVSIDELQKTADEAGIDRVYLESALRQVSQQKETVEVATSNQHRRIASFAIAMICAVFLITVIKSGAHNVPPVFFIALVAASVAASRTVRGTRRSRRRRFRD